jgi:hypothetical protein
MGVSVVYELAEDCETAEMKKLASIRVVLKLQH